MENSELETHAAQSPQQGTDVFPRRLDHVYIVRAASGTNSPVIYVGKTTRPGRALEHWAAASNARLAVAMNLGFSESEWPEIFTIPLPVPSWEDLAIYETTLIDFFKNDHRFDCVNGTDGDEIFRPRSVGVSTDVPPRSIEHHWESIDTMSELVEYQTKSSARWVTAPLAHPENGERLRGLLTRLAADGMNAFNSWTTDWPPFFGFLQGFGIDGEGHTLPWRDAVSASDIRQALDAAFILVSVTGQRFDDEEGVRPGFGIQIDEPILRERASRYWVKGSSSHPKVSRKTLSSAQGAPDQPKFVVAVSGQKGHYAVVGVWPIEKKKEWLTHPFPGGTKFEFPLVEPKRWQEAEGNVCRQLIGSRLKDELNWQRKGALWCL